MVSQTKFEHPTICSHIYVPITTQLLQSYLWNAGLAITLGASGLNLRLEILANYLAQVCVTEASFLAELRGNQAYVRKLFNYSSAPSSGNLTILTHFLVIQLSYLHLGLPV